MEITNRVEPIKSVSWGSIWGGCFSVLAVSILLSTLGASLGFSMIEPLSDEPMGGVATSVLVWYVVSAVISLAVGGYIAGRLAGIAGLIHGFLVWATALIIATILGGMVLGEAVKATGSALGSVASVTGSAVSGTGSALGTGISSVAKSGGDIFENIGLDTDVQPQEMKSNLADIIKKSGIKSLQPEYVNEQMKGAKNDISKAVKQIVTSPDDNDKIIAKLSSQLKDRAAALTKDVDRESLTKAISKNTELTPDEVKQAVDNIVAAKEKTSEIVDQRLAEAEQKIEEAKHNYAEFKQKAREEADKAAEIAAKVSLASFFALLLGAVVSSFTGSLGARTSLRRTKA